MILENQALAMFAALGVLPLFGAVGGGRVREAFRRASESDSLGESIRIGIGATITAIGMSLVSGIFTIADVVLKPLTSLGDVAAFGVEVIFGAPLDVILAGAEESMRSLTGGWSLGPFTLPFAVAIVLLTFWIVLQYLEEPETGNVIPSLPFDLPFIGAEEEGEDKGL